MPFRSPARPGYGADIPYVRRLGPVGLLTDGPVVEILAEAGHRALGARTGRRRAGASVAVSVVTGTPWGSSSSTPPVRGRAAPPRSAGAPCPTVLLSRPPAVQDRR